MDRIVIISGHGMFASGILSSLEMIVGKKENFIAIDFLKDMSDTELEEKMKKELEQYPNSEVLFVCDLMGGTPFKICTKFAFSNSKYEVVTGVNVGGLIDLSMKLNQFSILELANHLVEASKKAVVQVEKVKPLETTSNDGI